MNVTGVYWSKRIRMWCAYIWYDGNKIDLGNFYNKKEAINTRKMYAKQLGI